MGEGTPSALGQPEVRLPLNLGLNDGTYAPQACIDALRKFDQRWSLRNYSQAGNDRLRAAIAEVDGVSPDNVFLHNGSGPILKLAIPSLLRERVMASPIRVLRHLATKRGYPIITPRWTYNKVPSKAAAGGMHVDLLPLEPETGFRLEVSSVRDRLQRGPGLVYIANPNNPTGNLLLSRADIEPLLATWRECRFWIDEAYIQYADPAGAPSVSDLVASHPNLFVSRTFSFAYGLAAARIGYLLAAPDFVRRLEKGLTDYRLGILQEELALAALSDTAHLPFLREENTKAVKLFRDAIHGFAGIESFPSIANFVLFRFTDGRSGEEFVRRMKAHKIVFKAFEPFGAERYDSYFRITTGLPDENQFATRHMQTVLQEWQA